MQRSPSIERPAESAAGRIAILPPRGVEQSAENPEKAAVPRISAAESGAVTGNLPVLARLLANLSDADKAALAAMLTQADPKAPRATDGARSPEKAS